MEIEISLKVNKEHPYHCPKSCPFRVESFSSDTCNAFRIDGFRPWVNDNAATKACVREYNKQKGENDERS